MKKAILIGLITILFVVSCAQQFVCPDGSVVKSSDLCQEERQDATTSPSKATTTRTTTATSSGRTSTTTTSSEEAIPEEVEELFASKSKIRSISYDYKESRAATTPIYETFLKGDKIKINLPINTNILNSIEKDTVILNIRTKDTVAYCENEKFCIQVQEYGTVNFKDYYQETPFDWLDKVNSAEIVGDEKLFNRDVFKIKINNEMTYWVDSYYGLPLQILVDGDYYLFDNPIFNKVRDSDVSFSG